MNKPITLTVGQRQYPRFAFRRDVLPKLKAHIALLGKAQLSDKDLKALAPYLVYAFGNRFDVQEFLAGCNPANVRDVLRGMAEMAGIQAEAPAPPKD